MDLIKTTDEEAIKKYINKFLYNSKFILRKKKETIIHAEKAFKVASILRQIIKQYQMNQLTTDQIKAYFKAINDYLNNKIELFWEKNEIRYKTIKGNINATPTIPAAPPKEGS